MSDTIPLLVRQGAVPTTVDPTATKLFLGQTPWHRARWPLLLLAACLGTAIVFFIVAFAVPLKAVSLPLCFVMLCCCAYPMWQLWRMSRFPIAVSFDGGTVSVLYLLSSKTEVYSLDEGTMRVEWGSAVPDDSSEVAAVLVYDSPHRERGRVRCQLGFIETEGGEAAVRALPTFQTLMLVTKRDVAFPSDSK